MPLFQVPSYTADAFPVHFYFSNKKSESKERKKMVKSRDHVAMAAHNSVLKAAKVRSVRSG